MMRSVDRGSVAYVDQQRVNRAHALPNLSPSNRSSICTCDQVENSSIGCNECPKTLACKIGNGTSSIRTLGAAMSLLVSLVVPFLLMLPTWASNLDALQVGQNQAK
eukprot:6407561-Amphidinium_carterae.2